EHAGMMDQRVGPAVEQVQLALLREIQRMALLSFPMLEIGAQRAYLVGTQNRHGTGEAVPLVPIDLRRCQDPGHCPGHWIGGCSCASPIVAFFRHQKHSRGTSSWPLLASIRFRVAASWPVRPHWPQAPWAF